MICLARDVTGKLAFERLALLPILAVVRLSLRFAPSHHQIQHAVGLNHLFFKNLVACSNSS